jgi:hypothetical protein
MTIPDNRLTPTVYKQTQLGWVSSSEQSVRFRDMGATTASVSKSLFVTRHSGVVAETWTSWNEIHRSDCTTSNQQVPFLPMKSLVSTKSFCHSTIRHVKVQSPLYSSYQTHQVFIPLSSLVWVKVLVRRSFYDRSLTGVL